MSSPIFMGVRVPDSLLELSDTAVISGPPPVSGMSSPKAAVTWISEEFFDSPYSHSSMGVI